MDKTLYLVLENGKVFEGYSIGAEGVVITALDPIENRGQVKVMGQIWSAKAHNNQTVPEGAYLRQSHPAMGYVPILWRNASNSPEASHCYLIHAVPGMPFPVLPEPPRPSA